MKKHTRLLSLGLAVLFSVSCLIFPASAVEGLSFASTLNGAEHPLLWAIGSEPGTLPITSRSLPFDGTGTMSLPKGKTASIWDHAVDLYFDLDYDQAITFTIALQSAGKVDLGYTVNDVSYRVLEGTQSSTSFSVDFRIAASGLGYFWIKNVGGSTITITSIHID